MAGIGVPIKLLHEAIGHIVTCEIQNGTMYRGKLIDAEDSMNIQLEDVQITHRDGRVQKVDNVFIRGSQVRFFTVPDMLKHAPMFKNIGAGGTSRGPGLGIQQPQQTRTRGGSSKPSGPSTRGTKRPFNTR